MDFVFLSSQQPLTKTFSADDAGNIAKSSYPNVFKFTSHIETCTSLKALSQLITKHANLGHCLLKGVINKILTDESRAGATVSNDSTQWVCLDIDGIASTTVTAFLTALDLADYSYIIQYSASSLIFDKKLRAHIILMLDRPYPAPLLKQWLIDLNHRIAVLSAAMELTRTDTSIRWPLDISVCQNDKLIYIAPPILKKVKDPHGAKNPRIAYVQGQHDTLSITDNIPNITVNQKRTDDRINELREAKGLPARKYSYRIEDGQQILAKPDQVTSFETKFDRGFIYFNLNGGDSWGYYHPDNNPKYIRNFKGEPTYLTKELLPEYWDQLQSAEPADIEISQTGFTYLAFSDRKTSMYWKGTYDAASNQLDITATKSAKIVTDFVKAHGLPNKDFIPEWDVIFDPQDPVRVDPVNHIINTFAPTLYMSTPPKKAHSKAIPPLILRVINHALGDDVDVLNQFINWVAFIAQERRIAKTAWVIHGNEGTGKGILMHRILAPLFGHAHTTMRRMEELTGKNNGFVKNMLIVCIDEVETKSLTNESNVLANLRNFITEPTITTEDKYIVASPTANFSNWLFFSNKANAVSIPKGDRRFNVAKYQPTRLEITDEEIDQIAQELQAFYDYLILYPVDLKAVGTPLNNESRNEMSSIASSSDAVADALIDGDFGFFIGLMPSDDEYHSNAMTASKVMAYEVTLNKLLERARENGWCNISRDEMMKLFDYAVGGMPTSPHKFTTMLKHKRISTKKVRVGDRTVYGMRVEWRDHKEWDDYTSQLHPVAKPSLHLKVVKK